MADNGGEQQEWEDIIVYGHRDKIPDGCILVNPTSRASGDLKWGKGLSPFFVGPIDLYGGHKAENLENAWQFCKVYAEHCDADGEPTDEYYTWAAEGWADTKPHRFPMGRGAKPEYSLWDGDHLLYIEARLRIYAPLYAQAVEQTQAWVQLQRAYQKAQKRKVPLALFDFDGHDSLREFDGSFERIIYNHRMKMGHAFVLAMMLKGERVWEAGYDATLVHDTPVAARPAEGATKSKTSIFVANIPPDSVSERTVAEWVSDFEVESMRLMTNRRYAFLEVADEETQQAVIAHLNGLDLGITVEAAWEQR